MDTYEASIFLQAQACMARVAGMQAENAQRGVLGYSMAYDAEAFEEEAKNIEHYAGVLHSRSVG